jgi:hypothetical protein
MTIIMIVALLEETFRQSGSGGDVDVLLALLLLKHVYT